MVTLHKKGEPKVAPRWASSLGSRPSRWVYDKTTIGSLIPQHPGKAIVPESLADFTPASLPIQKPGSETVACIADVS